MEKNPFKNSDAERACHESGLATRKAKDQRTLLPESNTQNKVRDGSRTFKRTQPVPQAAPATFKNSTTRQNFFKRPQQDDSNGALNRRKSFSASKDSHPKVNGQLVDDQVLNPTSKMGKRIAITPKKTESPATEVVKDVAKNEFKLKTRQSKPTIQIEESEKKQTAKLVNQPANAISRRTNEMSRKIAGPNPVKHTNLESPSANGNKIDPNSNFPVGEQPKDATSQWIKEPFLRKTIASAHPIKVEQVTNTATFSRQKVIPNLTAGPESQTAIQRLPSDKNNSLSRPAVRVTNSTTRDNFSTRGNLRRIVDGSGLITKPNQPEQPAATSMKVTPVIARKNLEGLQAISISPEKILSNLSQRNNPARQNDSNSLLLPALNQNQGKRPFPSSASRYRQPTIDDRRVLALMALIPFGTEEDHIPLDRSD